MNERIARGLARRLVEIKARLGSRIDLEPWDRGWVRLYETHPMEGFDPAAVSRTAARVAELIRVLWPLYLEISRAPVGTALRGLERRRKAVIKSHRRAGVTQR